MFQRNYRKVINTDQVFDDYFLNGKNLYVYYFNMLPNSNFIGNMDGEKAFEALKEKYASRIAQTYQYRLYERSNKKFRFDTTVVVLTDNCLIQFDCSYCEILHDGKQSALIDEISTLVSQFKEKQRRKPLEINLIVQDRGGFKLKGVEIKRTKLDLDLFYEDDFRETDGLIRKRLNQHNDKGIVLLHGLPGAGKTTYIRYLVGKIKKKVLFLPPSAAGNLTNPEFIELLVRNPNTVLIIEDAENVIMDRRHNPGSSVSNLLNISDGLLADFLNVQLICTFNNSLTLIDSALMRKGRLIAKYEFGKLGIVKAQRLSRHLGLDTIITRPMTVAEIANPHEKEQAGTKVETIGFRRVTALGETY